MSSSRLESRILPRNWRKDRHRPTDVRKPCSTIARARRWKPRWSTRPSSLPPVATRQISARELRRLSLSAHQSFKDASNGTSVSQEKMGLGPDGRVIRQKLLHTGRRRHQGRAFFPFRDELAV